MPWREAFPLGPFAGTKISTLEQVINIGHGSHAKTDLFWL